jgi:hypothetical protein
MCDSWRNSFSVTMSYQGNLRPITEIHWGHNPADIVDEVHSSVYYIYRDLRKENYVTFSIDIVSQAEEKKKEDAKSKEERELRRELYGERGERELREKELRERAAESCGRISANKSP